MKKVISVFLSVLLVVSLCSVGASAEGQQDILISRTEEVLENGDIVVTELYENAIQPRTGKSAYKTSTCIDNTTGGNVWTLKLDATFEYVAAVTSAATSATATVMIQNAAATFVSKDASYVDNIARGSGKVLYKGENTSRTLTITCDKYGNLT